MRWSSAIESKEQSFGFVVLQHLVDTQKKEPSALATVNDKEYNGYRMQTLRHTLSILLKHGVIWGCISYTKLQTQVWSEFLCCRNYKILEQWLKLVLFGYLYRKTFQLVAANRSTIVVVMIYVWKVMRFCNSSTKRIVGTFFDDKLFGGLTCERLLRTTLP
jgi:hypothetical protein